jgi:hypothetical protein
MRSFLIFFLLNLLMNYSSIIFGQSKKIQIEDLKLKIDSLNSVLSKNRDYQTNYNNQLLDSINKLKLFKFKTF